MKNILLSSAIFFLFGLTIADYVSISNLQHYFSFKKPDTKPIVEGPLKKLRDYIRIDTSKPSPKYDKTMGFLSDYALELGLDFQIFRCKKGDPPIGIMTWKGKNPKLTSIILNSHTDVVPAVAKEWKYDPFNATLSVDEEGRQILVGRGSQDCKSLGVMYLEAIRNVLKLFPAGPPRTVHLTFVPDEEIGGERGMQCFSRSPKFKELFGKIGLVLDEGFLNDGDEILAFYSERVQRGFKITAKGNSGHASQFITNLATDKLLGFETKARIYRFIEQRRMENLDLQLGDVSTINLDMVKVGSALNVVPGVAEAWYDARVTPLGDVEAFKYMVQKWATESDVEIKFLYQGTPFSTNVTSNGFWDAIKETAESLELPLKLAVFPAATDSRHLRKLGIPAIGITPIRRHPIQAHAIDESIQLIPFYKGIDFYTQLLPRLVNSH